MTQPGKDFWLPFHVKDFYADMIIHPHEIGGAWILILCKLHATGGEASKPLSQWAKILNTSEEIALERLEYLKTELIADVTFGETITVVSRRMSRDQKDRIGNRKRQADYRKRKKEQDSNAPVTPIEKKRIEEEEKEKKKYVETSDEVRLSNLLFELIRENNPNAKKPNIQSWAKVIDLMIRRDERTPADIEAVMRWAQNHHGDKFSWASNILSTAKLREKFDQLTMQMQGGASGKDRKHSTANYAAADERGGDKFAGR